MKKKIALSIAAIALVICCAVGGTLAWLTDQTGPVVNTFTVGNIDITLTESEGVTSSNPQAGTFKMVPGNTIEKDPKVTVEAGSEACWLFVKVEESTNFDSFLTYTMADGWTQLTKDKDGNDITDLVFYREVAAPTTDQAFAVLADDQVTVKNTVTKADMDGLTSSTLPTLTFTAYAVQKDNIADEATAWAEIA